MWLNIEGIPCLRAMPGQDYVPPKWGKEAFHCPYCGVLATQAWSDRTFNSYITQTKGLSKCGNCGKCALWKGTQLVFPAGAGTPAPATDMPPEVLKLYQEARGVYTYSPRAAAALLRVALEKLTEELGEEDADGIYEAIGNLVERGLHPRIQKAMDIVRVTGNDASHPGEINFDEEPETAQKLFTLLNHIVDTMITQRNEIDELFEGLPESKKDGIRQRDQGT